MDVIDFSEDDILISNAVPYLACLNIEGTPFEISVYLSVRDKSSTNAFKNAIDEHWKDGLFQMPY